MRIILSKLSYISFYIQIFAFFSILSLLFFSCTKEEKSDFKYELSIDEFRDSVRFSEIIDSVSYIRLETNQKNIIYDIEQILVNNGLIFIQDRKSVSCFDLSGKWKYTLKEKGHAKNEFIFIQTISVDNNKLYVYDNAKHEMIIFDANSGEFIDYIQVPYYAINLFCVDGMFISDTQGTKTNSNPTGELYQMYDLGNEKKSMNYLFTLFDILAPIQSNNLCMDGLNVSSYFYNKMWKITSNGIEPYLNISFPEDKAMTQEEYEVIRKWENGDGPLDIGNHICGLVHVQETNDYITGDIMENEICFFIYNKKQNRYVCYKDVYDDFWFYLPASFAAADNSHFYSVIDPKTATCIATYLREQIENNKASQNDKDNYQLFNKCNENDNPVIAMYHINKNI